MRACLDYPADSTSPHPHVSLACAVSAPPRPNLKVKPQQRAHQTHTHTRAHTGMPALASSPVPSTKMYLIHFLTVCWTNAPMFTSSHPLNGSHLQPEREPTAFDARPKRFGRLSPPAHPPSVGCYSGSLGIYQQKKRDGSPSRLNPQKLDYSAGSPERETATRSLHRGRAYRGTVGGARAAHDHITVV